MAKAKAKLDGRQSSKTVDGKYPLVLQLTHRHKTRFIPFGLSVFPEDVQFDNDGGFLRLKKLNGDNVDLWNAKIQKRVGDTNFLLAMEDYALRNKTINQVKEIILHKVFGMEGESETFVRYTESFIQRLIDDNRPGGTIEWYTNSARCFLRFRQDRDLALNEIDISVLEGFKSYMFGKQLSGHTRNDYLRGIRAILNHAIKDKVLDRGHRPFDDFKFPKGKTLKKALSKEELQAIRNQNYLPSTQVWHQRNYFLFMFNNRGMNFIDMAGLRVNQIRNNRLEYKRTKLTNEPVEFSIALTDEAREILSFYLPGKEGRDLVFPILPPDIDSKTSTEFRKIKQQALKQLNKYLKIIAADCGIEINMTSYVARYTWSAIARKMGYNIDLIGGGLGHTSNNTTKIYLSDFDIDVLDEMNQRVTG